MGEVTKIVTLYIYTISYIKKSLNYKNKVDNNQCLLLVNYEEAIKMNNKVLNLINKAIEEEFLRVEEKEIENTEYTEKYRELENQRDQVTEQLALGNSEDKCKLMQKLEDINIGIFHMVARYYFKKGVLEGLTRLKYLGDTKMEISFIQEHNDLV